MPLKPSSCANSATDVTPSSVDVAERTSANQTHNSTTRSLTKAFPLLAGMTTSMVRSAPLIADSTRARFQGLRTIMRARNPMWLR